LARDPIPTFYFALVVVRHGDRFLLVQERKHGQSWHLPAGRVEPGESLSDAAERETLEESGVKVRLTGILRLEHTPRSRRARLRVVFLAEPNGDTRTKQEPDDESLRAEWVSLSELSRYTLRAPEIEELLRYVADGGRAAPVDLIQEEGTPYTSLRESSR
jgi:8-oxo-dGTP pyrophosphatase MutT (NUDIX family)